MFKCKVNPKWNNVHYYIETLQFTNYLIDIDFSFVFVNKVFRHSVGPDGGGAAEGLPEVTVDRRTTDRLKTFHLTSGRDVETLIKQKNGNLF